MSARDWESSFSNWTGAEGTVEEEKAQKTISRVRDAISNSAHLASVVTSTYPKGSYPNRTNVVRDSDIDIAVELTELSHHQFVGQAEGLTIYDLGLTPYNGPYHWPSFKDHVEQALVNEFGASLVTRGNKAIRVEPTSTTLPVDVVPCETIAVHISRYHSVTGIKITPDTGHFIVNFPKQHLDEGLAKNSVTSKRYKRTVRILKRLENEMVAKNVSPVVPSFLIESLVWNVPPPTFMTPTTWKGIVESALVFSYGATKDDQVASQLLEANGVKDLFDPSQKWNRQQANEFVIDAWNYVGF